MWRQPFSDESIRMMNLGGVIIAVVVLLGRMGQWLAAGTLSIMGIIGPQTSEGWGETSNLSEESVLSLSLSLSLSLACAHKAG